MLDGAKLPANRMQHALTLQDEIHNKLDVACVGASGPPVALLKNPLIVEATELCVSGCAEFERAREPIRCLQTAMRFSVP